MQPKSKEFRVLAGALLAAALLAGGCKRPVPPAPPRALPHAGRTVRVACPNDAAAAVVEQHGGNGWGQREGAKVQVLRYEPGTEPPEADAWVIAPAELGRWAAAGQLQPVPESYLKDGSYGWNRLLIDATINMDYDPDPDLGGARFPPTVWPEADDIEAAKARWSELGLGDPKSR